VTKLAYAARLLILAAAASLAACGSGGSSDGSQGVRVTPDDVTLGTTEQQLFTAAPTTVTWSVREGVGGGSITAGGLYTAPGSAGTYTVVATDPASGTIGEARVVVRPATGVVTHGISIPGTHPRLWYDAARLARARAWYAANPFTPTASSVEYQALERATRGLLNAADPADQQVQCRAALDWAIAQTAYQGANAAGGGSAQTNYARWYGEAIIATYDWCHAFMSPAERSAFIANTNAWTQAWMSLAYGGPPMHLNNYYWGHARNQILWAIASYEDNVAVAETLLDNALVTRIANDFHVGTASVTKGGVMQEGSQYGQYVGGYASMPYATSRLLGRGLMDESNWWKEAVYALVYSTTPSARAGESSFYVFPHSDAQAGIAGSAITTGQSNHYLNFMTVAAMEWPGLAVGQHARQWLNTVGARASQHARSVDTGGTARSFADLPLEYFAPGQRWLYGRSSWSPDALGYFLQLGNRPAANSDHRQRDWGTWQIFRKGRFLSRETAVYGGVPGQYIAGWNNGPAIDGVAHIGHNSLLIDGAGDSSQPFSTNLAQVTRLESAPAYTFAAVDLTPLAQDTRYGNRAFVNWVREFVFARDLETFVVLDRVESSTASATKTFLAHSETAPAVGTGTATITNGDQQLVMTTLVPATSTYRVVTEGGTAGQYRIEVDTSPGAAQSYILTVLQAKDQVAPALSPSVTEDASGFTVRLDGATSIRFAKGMKSSGGSFTSGGQTRSLRADVQAMTVTGAGPAWQ
jgi:hypothetical protein